MKFGGLPEINIPEFDLCNYLSPGCPIQAGNSVSYIDDFGLPTIMIPPSLLPV